uniref:Ig-like domain-containing protein n=1 Tax=Oncorhynchus tshawytscha TaxID=74940 RepID=A0A8C8F489_ONCTS
MIKFNILKLIVTFIIEKPEVINVTLGDAVSLECKVSGTPEIKVKWTKDGIELTPSRQNKLNFENNLSSLKIQSTQLEDAGDYLFEATNSVDTCSCKVKLIVVGQCKITVNFSTQEVLGSVVYMECKVAGSLPISVQWTKDGSVLAMPPSFVSEPESQAVIPKATVHFQGVFQGTPPFTVKWFKDDTEQITGPSCSVGLEGLSCFLDLYSVGFLQSGTYSCQVSNDAGTVKCTTNLLVTGWIILFFATLHLFNSISFFIFIAPSSLCL